MSAEMKDTEYEPVPKSEQLDYDDDGSDDTDALTDFLTHSGDDAGDLEFYRKHPGEVITEDLG